MSKDGNKEFLANRESVVAWSPLQENHEQILVERVMRVGEDLENVNDGSRTSDRRMV